MSLFALGKMQHWQDGKGRELFRFLCVCDMEKHKGNSSTVNGKEDDFTHI